MPSLFDPLNAGALRLKNRVVMAPLTRGRAGPSRVPNALMADYYAQRAGMGLIVTEACAISPAGYGWSDAPALYDDAQEHGWRAITHAVHQAGGCIVLQLWHMGRLSHSDLLGGFAPVAPSAIAAAGEHRSLNKPYQTPRALRIDEIAQTVRDYALCTARALRAGFDGVEIHAANGYLIDQFLRDGTNTRDDAYGGSIEKRARFMRDVVEAVADVAGPARTGIRLTAMNGVQSCDDSALEETMLHAARVLNDYGLAYLHVREAARSCVLTPKMRKVFNGTLIANDGYDRASAMRLVEAGIADAVAFGTGAIANPDLPARLLHDGPYNTPEPSHFYGGGAQGYTDYPFLKTAV